MAGVLLLALPLKPWAIQLGDVEQDAIAELGYPVARVAMGNSSILTYPRGTIRIANGIVAEIDLEEQDAYDLRIAGESAQREKSVREASEKSRMLKEEGERVRAERESDATFLAASPEQRLLYWKRFMARYPGVPPGNDYTKAGMEVRTIELARKKAELEERRIRELENRLARAEERAAEAERRLARAERRLRSSYYTEYPYCYPSVVPYGPRPLPPPSSPPSKNTLGRTIVVNGFEQFQATTNRTSSTGFGIRIQGR